MPTAIAATIGRVLSKVSMTPAKPFSTWISGLPSRLSLGMRALSKRITAVSEALMPSLCSRRSTVTPGCSRGTMNDLIAARPSDLSSVAHTTMWVAREPAVTKIFSPLMTYSSPSSLAVVDTAAESEPKLGSVMAIAAHSLAEPLQLFVGGHAGDRGVAEALARHRQHQCDIAPADLDHVEHGGHVAAVVVVSLASSASRNASAPANAMVLASRDALEQGRPACPARRGRRAREGRTCARSAAASRRRPGAPSR